MHIFRMDCPTTVPHFLLFDNGYVMRKKNSVQINKVKFFSQDLNWLAPKVWCTENNWMYTYTIHNGMCCAVLGKKFMILMRISRCLLNSNRRPPNCFYLCKLCIPIGNFLDCHLFAALAAVYCHNGNFYTISLINLQVRAHSTKDFFF